MVRRGFTLVEVIVSLVLLATAALGLGAAAAIAQRALHGAELHERAVREAAAILDSVAFAGLTGSGSRSRAGVTLTWTAPAGAPLARVDARLLQGSDSITLSFVTRRVPMLPERQP